MDRTKFAVKLVGTKEGIVIEHNMKGRLNTQIEVSSITEQATLSEPMKCRLGAMR